MSAPEITEQERRGLSSEEASARLRQFGPNVVPEPTRSLTRVFLKKFMGPSPWMLEAALALELMLGKHIEAIIIGTLLVFNAVLSFRQETRAHTALEALRSQLRVTARVLRDGQWSTLAAHSLVPGDVIRVRMGDIVPGDLRTFDGTILADQSALTGESTPAEIQPGGSTYAGAIVKRGEATGLVSATGARSYFGRTAELVGSARAKSRLEELMLLIVRYLVALDVALVLVVFAYTFAKHLSIHEVLPFALILLVASVPVALPATFTLTTALASLDLAKNGVLVTRLAAIDDAAALNVLCSDKTGTLTQNRLTLSGVAAFGSHTEEEEVLRLAALASDAATQDPIDLAILERAGKGATADARRISFVPFDPATKRSEAMVRQAEQDVRIVKGAPKAIAGLATHPVDLDAQVERLAGSGHRVIAVAAGPRDALAVVGLLALADPPRDDSKTVVERLRALGIRIIMVTGDGAATAAGVAKEIGLGTRVAERGEIEARAADADVFAGVFPEDKFRLVEELQRRGFVVGMTGDGVNDAPALKQAEVGIAVASATDVAKSAASVVLTRPGLTDALAVVETGRRVYQRMLTWTLNKLVKTLFVSLLLTVGLLATGAFVTTPRHILLLIFTNDFVTMSLASDRVTFSPKPDRWNVRALVVAGGVVAFCWLVFAFATLFVARDRLHLALPQIQTIVFLVLVFTGQATMYLLRERGPFWGSRPGTWLLVASIADVAIVGAFAVIGILVEPVPAPLVLAVAIAVAAFALVVDRVKVDVFRRVGLGARRALSS